MRILHVIPTLAKGGAERITIDVCKALTLQGHEVKLLVLHPVNDYAFMTADIDVTFLDLKFQYSIKGKHQGNINEFELFIKKFQPEVIHSHLFESEILLSLINYNQAKYIVHFHDNMPQLGKWQGKWSKSHIIHYIVRKRVLISYKKKDVIFVAISNDTLSYIHKNLPKHSKSTLLFNAINRERFIEKEEVDRIPFSLLMIGSLVDKKNQQLAIKVVKWLRNEGYNFTLDLLGEGPNRSMLQELISSLDLENYVKLHGNVDYPENYLKSRQFYLHTATYEPFGLVLVEAMTSRIPIISIDGHGNRDLIKNDYNGVIESNYSDKVIAEHIIRLIKDKALTAKIIANAFEFSKVYSIENYALKLIEIYKH